VSEGDIVIDGLNVSVGDEVSSEVVGDAVVGTNEIDGDAVAVVGDEVMVGLNVVEEDAVGIKETVGSGVGKNVIVGL
jgi:hypothetical protein